MWGCCALLIGLVGVVSAITGSSTMCQLRVPDTTGRPGCFHYDLSKLSSPTGHNTTDGKYQYVLNGCQNVEHAAALCPHGGPNGEPLRPSPAYQVVNGVCYSLGNLSTARAAGPDGTDPSKGFKLMYSGGDSSGVDQPRAVLIEFVCDKGGKGEPTTVYQGAADVYYIRWPAPAACPTAHNLTESCPVPPYDNTWQSVALRPRPAWFDNAKFGIFIHWGLFSVPSFKTEWYWNRLRGGTWGPKHSEPFSDFVEFHNRVYGCSGIEPAKYPCVGPNFTYADFAPMFQAQLFDPDRWASVFAKAGAKYVVLTSKHHEGWCNWPSAQHWNFNSMDTGPHRDLVGDLTAAVRRQNLTMGLYHSLREWYNPIYIEDNDNGCKTTAFTDDILIPSLKDLAMRYKPDVFWADGAGDAPCTMESVTYWKAPDFASWLYNHAPNKDTVVINNRWGGGSGGDYQTGGDRYSPGKVLPYKWECCYTIQKHSWGYDRTEHSADFLSPEGLLKQLVETVSCGGNLLLNIGPTADGRIVTAFEDRLLAIGQWLQVNGEAIYDSRPWTSQNDTAAKTLWYTTNPTTNAVYAMSFVWPSDNNLILTQVKHVGTNVKYSLLGHPGYLVGNIHPDGLHITLPTLTVQQMPCQFIWTVKLMGVF